MYCLWYIVASEFGGENNNIDLKLNLFDVSSHDEHIRNGWLTEFDTSMIDHEPFGCEWWTTLVANEVRVFIPQVSSCVYYMVKMMQWRLCWMFLNIFEWAVMDRVFHHPCWTTRCNSMGVNDGSNYVIKHLTCSISSWIYKVLHPWFLAQVKYFINLILWWTKLCPEHNAPSNKSDLT